jgi:MFS family permease
MLFTMSADEPSPTPADLLPQFATWHLPPTWESPSPPSRHSAPVYLAAWAGTALAGALFPVALLITALIVEGRPRYMVGQAVMVLAMGGVVGLILAAFVGALVFPLVGLIQWLASLYPWRTTMASIAGGWTGVVATQATVGQGMRRNDFDITGIILTWIALAMGHVGAGWFARRQKQKMAIRRYPEPEAKPQFTIRQLLGLTTGVAIVAAIVSAMRLPQSAHAALLSSLLLQVLGVSVYHVLARRGARHANAPAAATESAPESVDVRFT